MCASFLTDCLAVITDTFAVVTLANSTNSWARPSVYDVHEDLDTTQEKTIGMRASSTPYWIDVTFTLVSPQAHVKERQLVMYESILRRFSERDCVCCSW